MEMGTMYWSNWYAGWGWFLWFGFMILVFSGVANLGYTYRVHRFHGRPAHSRALDIFNQRYERGEITHFECARMKSAIAADGRVAWRERRDTWRRASVASKLVVSSRAIGVGPCRAGVV
jgi:putative membrane protein